MDAIDLERQLELHANHIEAEDLSQLWVEFELEEKTRVRDCAIISVLPDDDHQNYLTGFRLRQTL